MCLAWNQVEWPETKSTQYLCQFPFTQIMYVKRPGSSLLAICVRRNITDTGGESIGNPQCMNNK